MTAQTKTKGKHRARPRLLPKGGNRVDGQLAVQAPAAIEPRPPTPVALAEVEAVHPAEAAQLELIRQGQTFLSVLPAASAPEHIQTCYVGDALILKRQLLREHGNDTASVLLAETAMTAFVQNRQATQRLTQMLADGADKVSVARAEKLSKIQDRSHRQMLSAIEALRRPGARPGIGPVKVEVQEGGTVKNLNLGQQTVVQDDPQ